MMHVQLNRVDGGMFRRCWRAFAVVAFCGGTLAAWNAWATDASAESALESVEQSLADVETVRTKFRQTKHLAMFSRPLDIRGELFVENPDRMAWRVEEPVRYTMVIEGATLAQWDQDTDRVQRVALDRDPAFTAVFEQLTMWFSGRYSGLIDKYDVRLESEQPTVLVFTPKPGTMFEKLLEGVRVEFRDDSRYVHRLVISEGTGDRTEIEFHDTQLNVPLDDSVWEVRPR